MFESEQPESEISRMLKADIQSQKKTALGIHGRALRLRKHECVRMPSDCLSGLAKKIVTLPSILRITTIGVIAMETLINRIKTGEIPLKSEFEELDFENNQNAIAELRRLHTNHEIMGVWKCSSGTLSNYFEKVQVAKSKGNNILTGKPAVDYLNKNRVSKGLPKIEEEKEKRPYHRTAPLTDKSNLNENIILDDKIINDIHVPVQKVVEVKSFAIENNYLINVKRKFKTKELESFLERLSLFLSEDGQEFLVEIKVTEVVSK